MLCKLYLIILFIYAFSQIKLYHILLKSNLIHTDSGMSTISTYLLNLFKHTRTSWLGTIPHLIIYNIGEIKNIDQCRTLHTFTADCFPLKIVMLLN
ncbi:unnamed protein product [Adineta steineri]|uniref:Uncharacterized protein n=1 Tax=Adineta steineri TaxID=433720 RepID=A0A818I519_9BILA|nr:unnamed protein product [Adineta steineri]